DRDWCGEHSVPGSACVECKPGLMPRPPEYGWCGEHGVHDCPLDHPDVAQLPQTPTVTKEALARARQALDHVKRPAHDQQCKQHRRRLQSPSPETLARAGIKMRLAQRGAVEDFVAAPGEITYDQTRVARLSSRLPGTVWRVLKNVGDPVKKGEVVAVVDA